ncbi:uncharacterized protein DS421_5g144100 [Arachis hypogaea]|nr:uncharacterized protein DS421_5g144100 [Arachis hypogaea]
MTQRREATPSLARRQRISDDPRPGAHTVNRETEFSSAMVGAGRKENGAVKRPRK